MSYQKEDSKFADRFLGQSMMFSAALLGLSFTDSGAIQFFYVFVMAVLLPLLLGLDKKGEQTQVAQENIG
ncbi:hypothetical protein L1F30_13420 [Simiduia sp. 21SJ11W-1]|uniref:hypothetical protein n=1 Tax=Simiduia sp. 21SJ11W-1 TaxID=2909669 RepID=UPI00209CC45B|nr:hypothetical protein [Simiduia sp. 21SJ11W-1]UTA47157.1 hypothetical protein L1F30_13420 [Simiduia sp. 21SJ11W-1]